MRFVSINEDIVGSAPILFHLQKYGISYFVCVRVVRYLPYLLRHPKKNQVCLVVVIGFRCRVRVVRGLEVAGVVEPIIVIGRK